MHTTLTGTHDSVGNKYFTSHVHTQKKEVTLTLEPNSHTLSLLLANVHAVSCSHACTNTHMRTVKLKLSACRSISLPRANTPTGWANAHLSLAVVGDAFLSWTQKSPKIVAHVMTHLFCRGKKTQRAFITLPLVGPRSRRVSLFNKFPFALA